MNARHSLPKPLLATIAIVGMFMVSAQAASMSQTDYKASKSRISDTYKVDKRACSSQTRNAKDICIEEARAKEKVNRAELEFSYTGTPKDQTRLAVAKAEAAYSVAKEKCDDEAGNAKDVCRKAAKATEVKGLADAKMGQQIQQAQTDAAQSKIDADYKLAAEKCDALAGDAKAACVMAAKSRYGKT